LAELEQRTNDAIESYLNTVRLGRALIQGGVIIDSLVGSAVDAIGLADLARLAPNLDAKQSRDVATALEPVESRRESVGAILDREHAWSRRTFGLKGQIGRLLAFKSVKQGEQRAVAKIRAQQIRSRILLIQLASHAYELEKGERPKSIADLVPAYLKAIPQDPVTGTNLLYRP